MRKIAAILLLALTTPAGAGQPISESLAECSALYGVTLSILSHRDDERTDKLAEACDAYHAEAIRAAAAEGHADPTAHIARLRGLKVDKWAGKSPLRLMLSEDFRDWADYCRALGRHRGIDVF